MPDAGMEEEMMQQDIPGNGRTGYPMLESLLRGQDGNDSNKPIWIYHALFG